MINLQKQVLTKSQELEVKFSDVMDNMHILEDIDHVPDEFLEEMKKDKTRQQSSIVEYNTSGLAIVQKTLLINYSSIEKNYSAAKMVLIDFSKKMNSVIIPKDREEFVDSFKNKIKILEKIESKESYLEQEMNRLKIDYNYLTRVNIASKVLMCFNAEFGLVFNSRIDLILLGFLTKFSQEIKLCDLVQKKFKKSSVAWHYRKIMFQTIWAQNREQIITDFKNRHVDRKDLHPTALLWEKEEEAVTQILNKNARSYKLWEYLTFLFNFVVDELRNLIDTLDEQEYSSFLTEVETMLIEQGINCYERAQSLCSKNVHNNCVFNYIQSVLRKMWDMKINEFLEDVEFYKNYLKDHIIWANKLLEYYNEIEPDHPKQKGKWRIKNKLIEYSKMESLKLHLDILKKWDDYVKFYRSLKK